MYSFKRRRRNNKITKGEIIMEIKKAIRILESWIEADRKWRTGAKDSDFDKLCEERNKAIETLIKAVGGEE